MGTNASACNAEQQLAGSGYTYSTMRRILFSLCAFFLVACSSQALDQDGGNLTRGEVEFLASHMSDATEAEYPLLKHKLVNRYVTALGQSLVSHDSNMPPLPYEFRVLRTNEVFAFSLPGGIVYISLGLLRSVELEGQLAAAISHELAHQRLNHPLIVWRRKLNSRRGQKIKLDFSGDWQRIFLGPMGALAFDKAMEEEADLLAPQILYKSKFDPRVFTAYLQLVRKLEVSDPSKLAAMTSLHPPFLDRLKWAKDGLIRLPPVKDPNLSSSTFQQIKAILKETAKKSAKSEPGGISE